MTEPIKIDISSFPVGVFLDVWRPLFDSNKDRYRDLYFEMRKHLSPGPKKEIIADVAKSDPFAFIFNSLCWENIIVVTYALNENKTVGRFKVLTNNLEDGYHFVIFDEVDKVIFDPTYEKFPEENLSEKTRCKGTGCTKEFLGTDCIYMNLEFYLRDFSLPENINFNSQLREYGDRFLRAIGA